MTLVLLVIAREGASRGSAAEEDYVEARRRAVRRAGAHTLPVSYIARHATGACDKHGRTNTQRCLEHFSAALIKYFRTRSHMGPGDYSYDHGPTYGLDGGRSLEVYLRCH